MLLIIADSDNVIFQVATYCLKISCNVFNDWFEGRNKLVCVTLKTQMFLIDNQNHKEVSFTFLKHRFMSSDFDQTSNINTGDQAL